MRSALPTLPQPARPQPVPEPPPIPEPRDTPYPGRLTLEVDATDTARGIIEGRMIVPVTRAGRFTLLYPKWMPGYHAPQNPLELFAGLTVTADGKRLDWVRDPVEVYAFHVEVPQGTAALEARFQFLSPTSAAQGDVVLTPDLLLLQWGKALLYPAGYFARRIEVAASLTLPDGWATASALEVEDLDGPVVRFATVALDVLVDSPVMAGPHHAETALDATGDVRLALFAHDPGNMAVDEAKLGPLKALVAEADRLFGTRPYDRYRFLCALSGELGGGGVEHHRSAEIILPPDFFTAWEDNFPKRDVTAHEYVHSWNGKHRRGSDSWSPSFQTPIRNSLMWVYEGQTQYWGHVLTARAGLWSRDWALQALAKVAATYDVRPGGQWRTLADTTRDPIINARAPQPWPSWQRNEDYYSEGQLLWLSIDTLLRELSGDTRSLDDFARIFFGGEDGVMTTRTYDFEEVVATLDEVAAHDWRGLLEGLLNGRWAGAPLKGLERGGYRLVYKPFRNDFCKRFDALAGTFDMRFSVGLMIGEDGRLEEVMWNGPGFEAGLTAGAVVETVDGAPYSEIAIGDAIERAVDGRPIRLSVKTRGRSRDVELLYDCGHRFPHLEPIEGARRRLDEILAARAGVKARET